MKCSECTSYRLYQTGYDEYPPLTHISYCSKGHWENGNPYIEEEEIDCPDFIKSKE